MCCLAKEHAENMKAPSAGALLFVQFNKRLLPVFDELCRRSSELCALMSRPIS